MRVPECVKLFLTFTKTKKYKQMKQTMSDLLLRHTRVIIKTSSKFSGVSQILNRRKIACKNYP